MEATLELELLDTYSPVELLDETVAKLPTGRVRLEMFRPRVFVVEEDPLTLT